MIIDYIKNTFKKDSKVQNKIQYSKYFPEQFYTNAVVEIDDTFDIFIKGSDLTYPKYMAVQDIRSFEINDSKFEEIIIDESTKFLYDPYLDTLYLLSLSYTDNNEDIKNDVLFLNKHEYNACLDIMEVNDKSKLLRVYNRVLSNEADEYIFIEYTKDMKQYVYIGLIIQPNFLR
jgi:hypothetical protein